jgi:hypothetical protein
MAWNEQVLTITTAQENWPGAGRNHSEGFPNEKTFRLMPAGEMEVQWLPFFGSEGRFRLKLAMLGFFLGLFALSVRFAKASSPANAPASGAISADDFDWRDIVPYLFAAAELPGDKGIQSIFENSRVLRAYIASQVRAECKPGNGRCDSSLQGFTVDGEVTKRIDGIVKEGLVHQHKSVMVDYPFARQSFPFTEISALRSDRQQDAYLVLEFADHRYRAADLQAKYGAPYDTDVFDRYSIFKYRLVSAHYISKAVFEINPVNGTVMKVAISLKAKKGR